MAVVIAGPMKVKYNTLFKVIKIKTLPDTLVTLPEVMEGPMEVNGSEAASEKQVKHL